MVFEKSLYDLIRGIRSHTPNHHPYILRSISEARTETRSTSLSTKTEAVLKLVYLQMLGYDVGWSSFAIVEVMSSTRYKEKRIGYLGAVEVFREGTDVLMLTTNLIKKDLSSSNPMEVSLAINALSHLSSSSLSTDLFPDLLSLLSHSRPQIRKRALLALYRLILSSSTSSYLRTAWPRIKERLEDEDGSVVGAAVQVVCELAQKSGEGARREWLDCAPVMYGLLRGSETNWMLIKIVKLFASLMPLEPRLVKKLYGPLINLIKTTPAMSLLYECIHTAIVGGMLDARDEAADELAELCTSKLRTFFEDGDQNLKYLALYAMSKMTTLYPALVAEHTDVILACVDDSDISIRLRALELVSGMASLRTLPDIVKRLMLQLLPTYPTPLPPHYRKEIVERVVETCMRSSYENVGNFEWYVAVLIDLAKIARVDVGEMLGAEMRNVCVRVRNVRGAAVEGMSALVADRGQYRDGDGVGAEVLGAAAWVCGEYSPYLIEQGRALDILDTLLSPAPHALPAPQQAVFITAILKIYTRFVSTPREWNPAWKSEVELWTAKVLGAVEGYARSGDVEVQGRSVEGCALLRVALEHVHNAPARKSGYESLEADAERDEGTEAFASGGDGEKEEEEGVEGLPMFVGEVLGGLFGGYELNPVAQTAQSRVPIPQGLDLDGWIGEEWSLEPPELVEDDDDEESYYEDLRSFATVVDKGSHPEDEMMSKDERDRRAAERRERFKDDPFYIPTAAAADTGLLSDRARGEYVDVDSIPIVELSLEDVENEEKKEKKVRRKKRGQQSPQRQEVQMVEEEMPEGYEQASTPSTSTSTRPTNSKTGSNTRARKSLFALDTSRLKSLDFAKDDEEEIEAERLRIERERAERRRIAKERAMAAAAAAQPTVVAVVPDVVEVTRKKGKKKGNTGKGKEGEGGEGEKKKKKRKNRVVVEEGGEEVEA
ncbi:AP-3 complex subunit delta [Saitoella coloradoensis]